MQRAWAYKNNPFNAQYRDSFKYALQAAWTDAYLAMDDYKASLVERELFPRKHGNVLKASFLAGHPDYVCFDSSWR